MVKPGVVSALGLALVAADAVWLLSWVSMGAYSMPSGGAGMGRALTALASPHTALLPAMLSIRFDVSTHCNKNLCIALTPPVTWFVVPLLAVPFDVLQLGWNVVLHGDGGTAAVVLSAYALFVSVCAALFSAVAYFTIYHAVKDNATQNGEVLPQPKRRHYFAGDNRTVSYTLR